MQIAIATGNKERAADILCYAHECSGLDTTDLDKDALEAFDLEH